jgi:predicted nucleic acid-binding protein
MICIDSDLIISILKGDAKAKAFLDSVHPNDELYTTSISVFEVSFTTRGLSKSKGTVLNNFLDTLGILDLDSRSALTAARIGTDLSKKGKTLHPMDLLIGGICLEHRAVLFTSNTKHFQTIPGLRIVDWRK